MKKVIEKYTISKFGDEIRNEDNLIISNRYYGVIDGATDKSGVNWSENKNEFIPGGKILSDVIKEEFEKSEEDINVIEKNIRMKFFDISKKRNIDLINYNILPAASVLVYDSLKNKIYSVGDCQFSLIYDNGEQSELFVDKKTIDVITSKLRKSMIQIYKSLGIDPFDNNQDLGRDFILPFLKNQSYLQNQNKGGKWMNGLSYDILNFKVIDGIHGVKFNSYNVPENVKEIIMTTDGIRFPKKTLNETLEHHNNLLNLDPHCINELLTTKGLMDGQISFDDMSYLRIFK